MHGWIFCQKIFKPINLLQILEIIEHLRKKETMV